MPNGKGPTLYLSEVLRAHLKRWKSFLALEKAIADANAHLQEQGSSGGRKKVCLKVDRRKLAKIIRGDNVSLTRDELVALDNYLTPYGQGLGEKPFFVKERILKSLVESGDVTFLLGAMPVPERATNDLSEWDVKAMAEIVRGMYVFRESVHFDIESVLFSDAKQHAPGETDQWQSVFREDGPSVCAIGSPRACHGTEFMLAKMFGVEAFRPASKALPFQFIWKRGKRDSNFQSAFALTEKQVEKFSQRARKEILESGNSALKLQEMEEPLIALRRGEFRWKDYGIVAAQRLSGGQVWLAVAGLSGTTTYATAVAIRTTLEATVPQAQQGNPSPILWAVVESEIKEQVGGDGGEKRSVGAPRIIHGPKHWPEQPSATDATAPQS